MGARPSARVYGRAGLATRSYLYVDDVAAAFDVILHRGAVGQTYNIGSQRERSVLSVAHDVLALFQQPPERVLFVRDRAFNDRRYFVCDKKLAALGAPAAARDCAPPAVLSPLGSSTWHAH